MLVMNYMGEKEIFLAYLEYNESGLGLGGTHIATPLVLVHWVSYLMVPR